MTAFVNTGQTYTPVPFASESITVSSAAKTLTAATYAPGTGIPAATQAWITCADDAVRYWLDGSTPTATVGHVLAAGDGLAIQTAAIAGFRAIRKTTDAILSVTYFHEPNSLSGRL